MHGHLTAPEVMWNERGLVQLEPLEVEILRLRAMRGSPATNPLLQAPSEEP
jgi:hypothetical protein